MPTFRPSKPSAMRVLLSRSRSGKGVGSLLCEAPQGPFRQKTADPFFRPRSCRGTAAEDGWDEESYYGRQARFVNGGSPMRTKFIAGNWKMYTNAGTARQLAAAVAAGVGPTPQVRVALCPPFPYLTAVAEAVRG